MISDKDRVRAIFADPAMTRKLQQWVIEMWYGHAGCFGIDRASHQTLQRLGLAENGKRVRCSRLGRVAYCMWKNDELTLR